MRGREKDVCHIYSWNMRPNIPVGCVWPMILVAFCRDGASGNIPYPIGNLSLIDGVLLLLLP